MVTTGIDLQELQDATILTHCLGLTTPPPPPPHDKFDGEFLTYGDIIGGWVPVGEGHHDVEGGQGEHEVEHAPGVVHSLRLTISTPTICSHREPEFLKINN